MAHILNTRVLVSLHFFTDIYFMDAGNHTDEFLAILGHEMRNSLSALKQALEVWSKSPHDPQVMDHLRHIMERQVHQLTRLSEDLIDEARVNLGKLELRCEHLSLQKVVDEACEEVRPFVDRYGHTLVVNMPEEPIIVYGDGSRMIQVFANLLQNAAKFTPRNGSLGLYLEREAETVRVRVCDNGCGIDQRCLPTLFNGQGQIEHSDMPANKGLGIGLKLVKAIVELHGGTVAVHSEGLGQGSEFTVLLPIGDESQRSPQEQELPLRLAEWKGNGQPLPALRVVVVDDEPCQGDLLARLLRKLGQSAAVASDGKEAIRLALKNRPQALFLDLMMHDMDGYELARRLRSHSELEGIVLIALSGNGDKDHRRLAWEAGIDKYLVKPTSVAELIEVLNEIPITQPLPVEA